MPNRRQEAFEAGFRNPLMGDIGPLQRLYGTVSAIGEELGGGDMGTPFGQRFAERQKATKAEVKRLQALREKHPEEFGRGMMIAQEQMDPYMLGLGTGAVGGMRPLGATRFEPAYGESPVQQIAGRSPMDRLPAPQAVAMEAAPYYRRVPAEMGTSPGPMNAFNQNQVGMTTGRYGAQGYAPEMAVTDFESYGPMAERTSPENWGRPIGKFDANMLEAYMQGRYNRMAGGRPAPMGGDYTLEELGSAVAPYRQGGLVYEPVGQQGAAPRQIGGPQVQAAGRLGYGRGPIEGEWSEVRGLGGPKAQGYGGGMDFGVTREGQAIPPSGMRFDPRAAVIGGGAGYMAGRPEEQRRVLLPPVDVYGRRAQTALSGQAPEAGSIFAPPSMLPPARPELAPPQKTAPAGKAKGRKAAPLPSRRPQDLTAEMPFDPNLNFLVTQALDQLLGGNEAERGRQYQQYYEGQGYY